MGKLYEKLCEYGKSDFYPYHMPGHKRRLFGNFPAEIYEMDITEIDGFDNLHHPEAILKDLQEKAAGLYGAEESFYLVNGSTGGILSAISAALPEGAHILMARNCHKSAYHGAYLRNLKISYLYPPFLEEFDISDSIMPQQVKEALDREPDVGAVFLVSPTYEGRIADIGTIAQLIHERGIPLIVDEAHGAHLGFEEHFAKNSCMCGADIVIHSVHKTLPAMTQTALLHVNGERINRESLRRFLHIYQSSSPSYVLMASIDNALAWVQEQGKKAFSSFALRYARMLQELSACRHLQFLPQDSRQDIGKLVISGKKAGISGRTIYEILRERYHLQLEMAAGSYCLAMFTVGESEEGFRRMTDALLAIDEELGNAGSGLPGADTEMLSKDLQELQRVKSRHAKEKQTEAYVLVCRERSQSAENTVYPLWQAWNQETELVPLDRAEGRYAGDFVNLYPPGIPILVPGEIYTREILNRMETYLIQGLHVQGVIIEKKKGILI